jgi:hypothetical protein
MGKKPEDLTDQRYIAGSIRTDAEVQAAASAWITIKKTFEVWVTIGRGVVRIRQRADQIGSRAAFARLMTEAGLSELVGSKLKSECSRLELIMRPENLDRVQAWHNGLPLERRLRWCSPASIVRNCPVFTEGKAKAKGQKIPTSRRPPKMNLEVAIDTINDYLEPLALDERQQVLARVGNVTLPEPDTDGAKPPFEAKEVSKNKTYRAYVDGNAYYEIELREGAFIALGGNSPPKQYMEWEVTKFVGKVNCPYKPMPESKETPEKRKARSEVNTKSRERTYAKALVIAQRDYERYK